MNLGRRRIKNLELTRALEELGFENVAAFLASGNLVCEASGSVATLTKRIEQGLSDSLGYEVRAFLRTAKDLERIARDLPFADRGRRESAGKLQVAFLRSVPSPAAARAALALESDDDWLALDGQELYWWPSGGMSQSELDLKQVETCLGLMTIRTHRTVERMAQKYF